MTVKEFFSHNLSPVEKILIVLIAAVVFIMLLPVDDSISVTKVVMPDSTFNEYPLIAWNSTQKKWNGKLGNIVKVKYQVSRRDTKLWIYNVETGELVHEQPYHRNPWDDGTPRTFTYHWMLWKSEYGPEILPGEYEIRLCSGTPYNVLLRTWIAI
jgi:hypothetical protein